MISLIIGIGLDICDIGRMRKASSQDGFKNKVFAAEEIQYAEKYGDPSSHYAAAFAAKEALAKAGGWGLGRMGLDCCFIRRTECGPVFVFSEAFQKILDERGVKKAHLSISHEAGVAAAMVVLEG